MLMMRVKQELLGGLPAILGALPDLLSPLDSVRNALRKRRGKRTKRWREMGVGAEKSRAGCGGWCQLIIQS